MNRVPEGMREQYVQDSLLPLNVIAMSWTNFPSPHAGILLWTAEGPNLDLFIDIKQPTSALESYHGKYLVHNASIIRTPKTMDASKENGCSPLKVDLRGYHQVEALYSIMQSAQMAEMLTPVDLPSDVAEVTPFYWR